MNRKTQGALLMALGFLLVVLAIAMLLTNSGTEPSASETTTTTTTLRTTTSAARLVTTTTATATTSTSSPPTTLQSARALVGAFVTEFGMAIANGDTEFVTSRLHPKIVEGFGADLCETWVVSQIMALEDYNATAAPQGPTNGTLNTPGGTVEFDDRYSVDVAFTFGGEDFEATADFIVEGDTVYFTGSCDS